MSDSHCLNYYHISSSSKVFIMSSLTGGGKKEKEIIDKKKIVKKKKGMENPISDSSDSSSSEKLIGKDSGIDREENDHIPDFTKVNDLNEVMYKDIINELKSQNSQLITQLSLLSRQQEEQNKKFEKLKKKRKNKKYQSSSSSSSSSSSHSKPSIKSPLLKKHNNNEISSSSSQSSNKPRIINLKNIKEYSGSEEFKEWVKLFNVQMNAGNYDNSTKLVTLVNYLGPNIQSWLANTDPEISKDYIRLCEALQNGFKKKQKTTRELYKELVLISQGEEEAVVTYETRLLSKVRDINTNMTDLDLKELFISGLEPNLQLAIRQLNKDKYNTEIIIIKAKEEEIKLNQVRASERERKNRNNFNHNNNNNYSNSNSGLCTSCKVDQATPGKSMCNSCFKKSKENNNNSNNSNNNRNNNTNNSNSSSKINLNSNENKLCIGCNLNYSTPGKSKCQSCFINKVNNNLKTSSNSNNNNNNYKSSSNPNNNNNNSKSSFNLNNNSNKIHNKMNEEKVDFIKNKVKYITINNSSPNPLFWDNSKLLEEKRCLYCTEFIGKHSLPVCKEKYLNYSPPEIRTLFSKSIIPLSRTQWPTGSPQSPP